MTNLATLIDSLPAPQLPSYYSIQDRQTILLALESAKQQARPYDGDYKAPWLLSDFADPEWITTNRGREELIRGEWKNVVRVSWRQRLPNGALLTDPRYERFLNTNKRIAFLARSGFVSRITAPVSWAALVTAQLQLARWVVLHEKRFMPENYGFKLLDQPALDALLGLLSEGGWAFAHQLPQRLLAAFYQAAFGESCPDRLLTAPYAVPETFISPIVEWLKQKRFYGKVRRGVHCGKLYLKRKPLASLIGEPVEVMRTSWKLAAFCRQFEPELQSGALLVNVFQETELPDQKTKTTLEVVELGAAENSLQSAAKNITTILTAHRHDPEYLPEPGLVSVRSAQAHALRQIRPSSHNLFIPVTVSPQIIIKQIRNKAAKSTRTEYYFVHRAMPTPESREPKWPIAQPVIEDIERHIDKQSTLETQSTQFVQRYRNFPDLLVAHLDYMCSRRHFMIWLMKRAGLRPAEMMEISVREHANILHDKRLLIPTKKRRRVVAPKRSFPITLKDATVVQRYLTSRMKYCKVRQKAGAVVEAGDALFIGIDGKPIKKTSLERDFARLVAAAGYQDVQACFSMFRHRFITYEVVVHLKEFMVNAGKSRQMMATADYESILKRVAVKTGHGSVQSIWHYLDLAWKEVDVWGGVDKAIDRLHAADRLYDDLLALKRDVEVMDGSSATKSILQGIADRLGEIIASSKQDIEVQEMHGKHP